ncbi:uncharacterized protein ABDE67_020731 [Symphorus nematophorus]
MPSYCIVPGCDNYRRKREEGITVSHHRLPTDGDRCREWLRAIRNSKYDENTPVSAVGSLRVCSLHFTAEDYVRDMQAEMMGGTSKKVLKTSAVPCLLGGRSQTAGSAAVSSCGAETRPAAAAAASDSSPGVLHPQPQDTWTVMDGSAAQVTKTDVQVDAPETFAVTMEKPARHYVVDEEAILQLMKNCPMCDRKCRCSKRTHGPYLVVYQSCYFCHYQRKWASQPEARNMNTAHTAPRRKPKPKNKASANAKAPSQVNKTNVTGSSESHEPSET